MITVHNRPALARFRVIAARLRQDRFITCAELSAELEVCYKTIERDLSFMRDQLELPIEGSVRGFRYSRAVAICPCCQGQNVKRLRATAKR